MQRPLRTTLLAAFALPAIAMTLATNPAVASDADEGVTLRWDGPMKLAVNARVALPNGCHTPESIMEATADNAPAVLNAIPVTIRVTVDHGLCTQDYRIHGFDLEVEAPSTANGVIVYIMRTDQPTTATLYPLPKR